MLVGIPVNRGDPSGLAWLDVTLVVLENVAGGANEFTGGFTGFVAEEINSRIYGNNVAQNTTKTMENALLTKAVEIAGYVDPKKIGLNVIKKAFKNIKKVIKKKKPKQKKMVVHQNW